MGSKASGTLLRFLPTSRKNVARPLVEVPMNRFAALVALAAASGALLAEPLPHRRGARPVFHSDSLHQSVRYSPGQRRVQILRSERNPETEQWEPSVQDLRTTFDVTAVDGRTADDLFVAGGTESGEVVIERWSLGPVAGAWSATLPNAGTALGTPVATSPLVERLVGGSYLSPEERPAAPALTRTELYRDPLPGGVRALQADPDGRYVLVLDGAGVVHQLEARPGARPWPLCGAIDDAAWITVRHHELLGRVYHVETWAPWPWSRIAVFVDADNDGLLDLGVELERAAYERIPGAWSQFTFNP